MPKEISGGRKTAYYAGMALGIIGAISFGSAFVSGIAHFGDFSNFETQSKSMMVRVFGGMALMIVGIIVMSVGARGAAGSGLVLDPNKAREDLENPSPGWPAAWSRMLSTRPTSSSAKAHLKRLS